MVNQQIKSSPTKPKIKARQKEKNPDSATREQKLDDEKEYDDEKGSISNV